MRWPHHSWRLTFQSWMFSIQSKKTFSKRVRHEPGPALAHGRHGPLGHRLDVDEPLGLEARLDDVVAALAATDTISCGARSTRSPCASRSARMRVARLVARQAGVGPAVGVHVPVVGHHVDHRQAVALAGLEVVVVVGRA